MQIALTVDALQDEQLIFAQQLGVENVVVDIQRWDLEALEAVRNRVEKTGLNLAALESLPPALYEKAILGLPGRDEEIDQVCATVRNVGRAGISLVGYRWTPPGVRRAAPAPAGRGDALVWGYEPAEQENALRVTPQEMWNHLAYFLERVVPAAEAAGVRLACHPDDPPVPSLGGVACVLGDIPGLTRLFEIAPGPHHGLDLCLGALATMPGADPIEAIGAFARGKRIFMVHLRNPRGQAPGFRNLFLDEGDVEMPRMLRALRAAGFAGPVRAARPPGMVGDTEWGHQARAFDIGYLQAVLQVMG